MLALPDAQNVTGSPTAKPIWSRVSSCSSEHLKYFLLRNLSLLLQSSLSHCYQLFLYSLPILFERFWQLTLMCQYLGQTLEICNNNNNNLNSNNKKLFLSLENSPSSGEKGRHVNNTNIVCAGTLRKPACSGEWFVKLCIMKIWNINKSKRIVQWICSACHPTYKIINVLPVLFNLCLTILLIFTVLLKYEIHPL